MKKFVCVVLMLLAVFSFAGCGNNNGNTSDIGKIESYDYILSDNLATNYDQGYLVFELKVGAFVDYIYVCYGDDVSCQNCFAYTDWNECEYLSSFFPKETRFFVQFAFNHNASSDYYIKVYGRKITDGKVAAETTVIYTEEFSFNF